MTTHSNSAFFSFTFTLLSIIGGCAIVIISFIAGGIYSAALEPDDAKMTAEVVYAAMLVGFAVYEFLMAGLVLCMARWKPLSWKLHAVLFVIAPLVIYFTKGTMPPAISLFLLLLIAIAAVYQTTACYHQRRQTTRLG